jgi:hypothetical protein
MEDAGGREIIGLVPTLCVETESLPLRGEPIAVRTKKRNHATQSVAKVRSHAERGNE